MHVDEIATVRAEHEAGRVFEVTAWREAPWWVLDVHDVGCTQVRWLADADHMARDLVACMVDVDYDTVRVAVRRGVGPVQCSGSPYRP
jgi:hypothetical protein